jgi:lactoylglutathione lyase
LACLFQVAISSDDVFKTCEDIKKKGGTITKEAFEIPGIGTKICATTDPDGYKVVFVDSKDFLKELQ